MSIINRRIYSSGLIRAPALELVSKVLNINQGHNEEKLRKSRTLEEYSVFVARVRAEETEGLSREEAIRRAVAWCLGQNILKGFLESNASEVMNMLMVEWNWDDAFAVQREEGREEGKLEDARAMFLEGMGLEVIVRVTKIPIDRLKKELLSQ